MFHGGKRVLEVLVLRHKRVKKISLPGDFVAPDDQLPAFVQDEILAAVRDAVLVPLR